MDLVVLNGVSSMISILLGNGNGSFQPATNYPLEFSIDEILVTDVNNDGYPDLLLIRRGIGEAVLYGTGNGQFSREEPEVKMKEQPVGLAAVTPEQKEGEEKRKQEEDKKEKKKKKKKEKKKKKSWKKEKE